MYEVIVKFADLKDNKHIYNVGDTYPREGAFVDESRCEELSTNHNVSKMPLIRKVEEPVTHEKVKVESTTSTKSSEKKPRKAKKSND